jgi:hypothetical protein
VAKHSKGFWKAEINEGDEALFRGRTEIHVYPGGNGEPWKKICTMTKGWSPDQKEEFDANVRLIVNAADLLAAAKAVIEMFKPIGDDRGTIIMQSESTLGIRQPLAFIPLTGDRFKLAALWDLIVKLEDDQ